MTTILPELSRKTAKILAHVDEEHAISNNELAQRLGCCTSDALLAAFTVVRWGEAQRRLEPGADNIGLSYYFYGVEK